jgi:hypothetical protein
MNKRIKLVDIIKEGFKDDAAAELKLNPIVKSGAFISLVGTITNAKDLSRAIEAFTKAILKAKPQLAKSVETDSRFKQIATNLNQSQGDKITSLSSTQQQTTKP